MKAIFKNDYSWKSGSANPQGYIDGAPDNINYKKGDSFTGLTVTLSSDKKQVVAYQGNYSVGIPVENFTLSNDDGTHITTPSADVESPTIPTKGKEDIIKKLLGAYNKNLIIAVVLVVGYLAYKKFKK